jgi:hypothetical protein
MKRVRTWVDASYAVHPDMKSHTGGVMSFGVGGLLCKSSKQKLNTKSSTEAELVGASDYLPNTIWVKHFLEAQGYDLEENVLEQDNESAIKLEKNGRTSAGPKSRHIDIRYFWIKDRLYGEDILVRHCPTLQMLADFFTKPLQGALFRRFRDVLLGYKHVDTLAADVAQFIAKFIDSTSTDFVLAPEIAHEITPETAPTCFIALPESDNTIIAPSPVEERVGNCRSEEGAVTEDMDADGFITVRTKREKRAIKNSNTVVRNRSESSNCKSVSRAILLKQSS